jgi:hypothetical protein
LENTESYENFIKQIQYIKVFNYLDVELLASHYDDLMWKSKIWYSKKYRLPLLKILESYVKHEHHFPFLVEYKDDFGWVEIGSYAFLGNGGIRTLKERRTNIPKFQICDMKRLARMHDIISVNKKYYLLT